MERPSLRATASPPHPQGVVTLSADEVEEMPCSRATMPGIRDAGLWHMSSVFAFNPGIVRPLRRRYGPDELSDVSTACGLHSILRGMHAVQERCLCGAHRRHPTTGERAQRGRA